jgi:hypothetical protein
MIQEFSFKGEPYVVFEQPTEVPDEIIKKEIKCLFFDNLYRIDNGYYFCCLSGDFDNTTNDSDDDYPFEDAEHGYFKYCAIPKETYNKIIRGNFSSNENNKSIKGGNNMEKLDLGQIISMKMVSSLVADDKKDIDIGKLYLLQSMQNNGKIEVTDVMKSKMISKLGLDKDTDELPLEKLMLLDMLQSGEMDLTKIISVKLMSKLFDEEEKEEKK